MDTYLHGFEAHVKAAERRLRKMQESHHSEDVSKRISRVIQKYRYTGCPRVVALETSEASNPNDPWTEGDLILDIAVTVEKEQCDDRCAYRLVRNG